MSLYKTQLGRLENLKKITQVCALGELQLQIVQTATKLSCHTLTSWFVYVGDRIAKSNRKLDKICS